MIGRGEGKGREEEEMETDRDRRTHSHRQGMGEPTPFFPSTSKTVLLPLLQPSALLGTWGPEDGVEEKISLYHSKALGNT